MSLQFNSDRLIRSSRRQPCPVCGRVKDADCAFTPDRSLVLCHHTRNDLIPGVDQVNDYYFCKNTKDDRAAVFVLDEFERRQW